jgi:hypothetical protein
MRLQWKSLYGILALSAVLAQPTRAPAAGYKHFCAKDSDCAAGHRCDNGECFLLRTINNFYGDQRLIYSSPQTCSFNYGNRVYPSKIFVKLFLSSYALGTGDPTIGFTNYNHFKNSCGPTAAVNLFRWYGIDKLEPLSAWQIGKEMKTNNWGGLPFPLPGTSIDNFRSVVNRYYTRHMPSDHETVYRHDAATDANLIRLKAVLSQGHPVAIAYKTGATDGHFAAVVGVEHPNPLRSFDDVIVYIANIRNPNAGSTAMTWTRLRGLWERMYVVTGFNPFDRFPMVYIARKGSSTSSNPGGGSSGTGAGHSAGKPPVQMK